MKGYKGMSKDMTCRGMRYEIGKSYHVNEPIALCQNGLHFCKSLYDVYGFYPRDGYNRFFEILAEGTIISEGKKSVASDITVIRELTDIEVNRSVYGNGYGYGNGDGYGDGNGDGNGYGYGYGNGYGYGYGYGDGNGDGYGDGNGDGDITKIAIFKE